MIITVLVFLTIGIVSWTICCAGKHADEIFTDSEKEN